MPSRGGVSFGVVTFGIPLPGFGLRELAGEVIIKPIKRRRNGREGFSRKVALTFEGDVPITMVLSKTKALNLANALVDVVERDDMRRGINPHVA